MQLTQHTDYALRVLIHLACYPGRHVSTAEISRAYGISNHHLVKVVHRLSTGGFLDVRRGRSGGIALGRAPADIVLGDVVRASEPQFHLVECFDEARNRCPITTVCTLQQTLGDALGAFFGVLDGKTLADVVPSARAQQYTAAFLTIASAPPQVANPDPSARDRHHDGIAEPQREAAPLKSLEPGGRSHQRGNLRHR